MRMRHWQRVLWYCLAVSQALAEGPLHTGTMGVQGAELNLFENGDLNFEV